MASALHVVATRPQGCPRHAFAGCLAEDSTRAHISGLHARARHRIAGICRLAASPRTHS